MFHYRDLLRKHCKRKELYSLLDHNKQGVPEGQPKGQEEALDRLCDMMMFGALAPCEECNGGPLVYRSWLGPCSPCGILQSESTRDVGSSQSILRGRSSWFQTASRNAMIFCLCTRASMEPELFQIFLDCLKFHLLDSCWRQLFCHFKD